MLLTVKSQHTQTALAELRQAGLPSRAALGCMQNAVVLLSDLEVLQRFSSDLKDTYLVVEVALYPGDDELDVAVGDFALQVSDKKRKLTLPSEDPARIDVPERKGGIAVLSSRSQRMGYPSGGSGGLA